MLVALLDQEVGAVSAARLVSRVPVRLWEAAAEHTVLQPQEEQAEPAPAEMVVLDRVQAAVGVAQAATAEPEVPAEPTKTTEMPVQAAAVVAVRRVASRPNGRLAAAGVLVW